MTVTINVREYRRAIQNEQSRETGKKWYTRQKQTKNNKQAKTKAQHNMLDITIHTQTEIT
jgi:lipid II:glycine glycyltransferase (peptidoglycan interpeptide bridge formation enzyme)